MFVRAGFCSFKIFDHNNEKYNDEINNIINKNFTITLVLYVLIPTIIYIFNFKIYNGSILILFLFIFRLYSEGIGKLYKNRLRIKGDSTKFFKLDLFTFISSLILNVLFLMTLENKFLAIYLATGFSYIIFPYIYTKERKYNRNIIECNKHLEKEINKYRFPLSINSVANWIFSLSDRMILNLYLGFQGVAMYSAGYKLGALAQILIYGWGLMWPAKAMAIKEIENKEVEIRKFLKIVSLALFTGSLLLIGIIKIIYPYFYNLEYQDSFRVVPLIVSSFVFLGIDMITSVGMFYEKKSRLSLISTLIVASINIIINILFIPKFGYIFAAFSTYISNLLFLLIRYLISKNLFEIKINILHWLSFIGYNILILLIFYLS